jgi:hypothetical protein
MTPRTMTYEILHEFPKGPMEATWRDLLSRLKFPSHYNAPEFFLEPFWTDKKPFAILALDGKRAVGVLTGIHDRDAVVCGLPSRPQIEIDPNVDASSATSALFEGLSKEAGRAKLITVYSWPAPEFEHLKSHGFRKRQLEGNVVLDLTKGADALFQQFTKDRRRNIRFAEKNGVTVRVANNRDDFRVAYEVYNGWQKTDRKEVHGERRTFEHFESSQVLTHSRRMFIAELEGKAIAINMFRFCPGGLFESAANCSFDEYLHLKPNDLLQWKGIQWACENGLRKHSLGGAHSFLLRFGGTVVPVVRYRMDRTLLRKHDLREMMEDTARRKLGPVMRQRVRKALGK